MTRLRQAGLVARQELRMLLRGRETLLWLFAMPIVFFYFIGTVTSRMGPTPDQPDPIAIATAGDAGFLAERLARRLEALGFRVVGDEEDAPRRLIVPRGFTAAALAGGPAELRYVSEVEGLGASYDELRVQRAAYSLVADLAAVGPAPATEDALARLDGLPRALSVEISAAGRRRRIPTGFEQAVPGIMVMFTLIVLLSGGAAHLVMEREQGLLRRLAATPIERGSVVLGKWSGRLALGLVQIAFAMLAGRVLFGMQWGSALPAVALLMLCWGALCASLGLLLGCLARTTGQAAGIGVGATNLLAALGGCWWPIEITPQWMQTLAAALPTGWAMDALHRLVSFQAPPASVLPHALAMLATAWLCGALAARSFRFH